MSTLKSALPPSLTILASIANRLHPNRTTGRAPLRTARRDSLRQQLRLAADDWLVSPPPPPPSLQLYAFQSVPKPGGSATQKMASFFTAPGAGEGTTSLPHGGEDSHVTVAVRVRGLEPSGAGEGADLPAIFPHEGDPDRSLVIDTTGRGGTAFTFDHAFWSLGQTASKYPSVHQLPAEAEQETIYEKLGVPVVEDTLRGYNCSVFACGQTGSGKTFTMMGPSGGVSSPQPGQEQQQQEQQPGARDEQAQRGLIPRISEALFKATTASPGAHVEATALGKYEVTHSFVVSYVEIYLEKVHDLLVETPAGGGVLLREGPGLKVREHPKTGPYVDGATLVRVHTFDQALALIELGNRNRAVASTHLNSYSSRSHCVFTIQYVKSRRDVESGVLMHQVSKLNLIDLAGSENAGSAGTTGERLKEGGSINRSLLTLGLVIKGLTDRGKKAGGRVSPWAGGKGREALSCSINHFLSNSSDTTSARPQAAVIPYRDSVLTFLLKGRYMQHASFHSYTFIHVTCTRALVRHTHFDRSKRNATSPPTPQDSLGGNARTTMLATVRPGLAFHEESLSTLKYASRARSIVNTYVVRRLAGASRSPCCSCLPAW